MTEKLLWDSLKEAQEKDQLGLLIWANWTVWDELGFEVKARKANYDFVFSQISKGEEVTVSAKCYGFTMPGFIAVPVQKLLSSDEYFKHVLNSCEKGHYEGPITLVPLHEISKSFLLG